jgi:nicotinate-nucleotide adenylyltransferase
VLELAELAVAEREAIHRDDVLDELYGLPGVPERVHFFSMPRIDISSSLIRRRVAEGHPIRWLVPEAVERAIAERGLYREEVAAR